jgi:hypothetical protein
MQVVVWSKGRVDAPLRLRQSPKLRTTTSSATGTSTLISAGGELPSTALSRVAMPLRIALTRQSSFPGSRFLATTSPSFTGNGLNLMF